MASPLKARAAIIVRLEKIGPTRIQRPKTRAAIRAWCNPIRRSRLARAVEDPDTKECRTLRRVAVHPL